MTWLYVPETSSACVQGSEGLSSESCSLSQVGERMVAGSLTWRGKEQQPQAWSRRWKQGGFIRRLSGLTCSPSTLDRGVEQFISSLVATPAKTTALQESAPEQAAIASSHPKSAASPKSAGLILSSERTCRGTRTDNSQPSSRHWSDWATALRQEYSVRPKPEIPCAANDCSSWPSASDVSTRGGSQSPEKRRAGGHAVNLEDVAENWAAPQARDHFPAHTPERIKAMKAQGHGMRNLNDEAATWHAPRANDPEKRGQISDDPRNGIAGQAEHWEAPTVGAITGGNRTRSGSRSDELLLTGQAMSASEKWSAPKASDGEKGGPNQRGSKGDVPLPGQAAQWAAPAARDHKGSSEGSMFRQDGKSRADLLDCQAEQFFRPPSSLDQPIAGGSICSTDSPNTNQPSQKRKLNPIFVEALMRWPTGLSGFERPETAWTQWWQLMPSYLSQLCTTKPEQQPDLFGEAA